MFDPTIIFQRSHTGRNEIYEKKHGLTQSERLVLIMIDGVTPYSGVRSKLPALTDERFNRAVKALLKKELVLEVFMPVEGQEADEVERTVADRFLQQDPTDPLTIISFDPDEDFGVFGRPISAPALAQSVQAAVATAPEPVTLSESPSPAPVPTHELNQQAVMDEALIRQADSLAEEVRARRSQYANQAEQPADPVVCSVVKMEKKAIPQPATIKRMHWGYWLIGFGLAFIVGFLIARMTR